VTPRRARGSAVGVAAAADLDVVAERLHDLFALVLGVSVSTNARELIADARCRQRGADESTPPERPNALPSPTVRGSAAPALDDRRWPTRLVSQPQIGEKA